MQKESFFRVFDYHHLMHDAIDCGLVYEDVIITKTIDECQLVKGAKFEQVNFYLDEQLFYFINWLPYVVGNVVNPNSTSIKVPQLVLAPYLKW
jgi:hypothetical protein